MRRNELAAEDNAPARIELDCTPGSLVLWVLTYHDDT